MSTPTIIKHVLTVGFVALAASAACLLFGKHAWRSESLLLAGTCMMSARLCGLISTGVGVVAIYNRKWWQGVMLLAGAAGLPIVSIFVYGFI